MARGTGGVFLRGTTWYLDYSVDGIRHKESAHTTVKSEAITLLKKRLGQAQAGLIAAGNPDMALLLDQVAADYKANRRKSTATAERRIGHLKDRWGKVKAKAFTTSQVHIHIAERTAAQIAPATINRELAILRRAFTLAIERQQIASAPTIKALTEDNARQGFFSDAEFSALRDHLPAWMRPLVTFAYFTGCRLGELREMTWDQVDLAERVVRLHRTKNGLPRTVPLTAELHALFSMEPHKSGYLFPGPTGGQILDSTIYKPWRAACAACKLTGRIFHDFRRTGVRNMIRAGVPREIAMAISGHVTDAMFRRYNIVSDADVRAAAAKIDAYISEQRDRKPAQQQPKNTEQIH